MHITVNPIVLFTVEFFTFLAASTDGLPTETARLQGEKGYEWHAHLILNAEGIYSRVFRFLDIYSCKQTWFCFEKKKGGCINRRLVSHIVCKFVTSASLIPADVTFRYQLFFF